MNTKPPLQISRFIPSIITIMGMCCGLTAMRYALDERWELSVLFIVLSAAIDGIDGYAARVLNSTSNFGAELDSLSDFLCFGIAPPFIMYLWAMHDVPKIGWAVVLFYTICCVIRLARFNVGEKSDTMPEWHKSYFVGVPSPSGALLAMGPLIVSHALTDFPSAWKFFDWFYTPISACIFATIIALLMVSNFPTLSAKKLSIPQHLTSVFMVVVALCLVVAFTKPWLMLMAIGLTYLAMLPVTLAHFYRNNKSNQD